MNASHATEYWDGQASDGLVNKAWSQSSYEGRAMKNRFGENTEVVSK